MRFGQRRDYLLVGRRRALATIEFAAGRVFFTFVEQPHREVIDLLLIVICFERVLGVRPSLELL